MTTRKNKWATGAGCLALSAGVGLHVWAHGTYASAASGFLLGVSIALLILGLARPSRNLSD